MSSQRPSQPVCELLERAREPVVAALEVRLVGRVVVGRREDREVRPAARRRCPRACRSPWCRRCCPGPVPDTSGLAKPERRRVRQHVVPTLPTGVSRRRRGRCPSGARARSATVGRYLAYVRSRRRHEAVDAVVAAVEVDASRGFSASARRPAATAVSQTPSQLSWRGAVDRRDADDAVAQQSRRRSGPAAGCRDAVGEAEHGLRRDRERAVRLEVGDGAVATRRSRAA